MVYIVRTLLAETSAAKAVPFFEDLGLARDAARFIVEEQ
jgi:hypothetical protein